ncbi:hypothetical protein L1267_19370 [Pseudoalteromonas sp. OFAV1]|uniref:hypothetical protein n=1 Tax=Pseudoalteromonas sp. OFAV1 TaxID=2908892 RepID=UPI001F43BFDA|nr:hypothetical protein [Pseudoalteromonas sp. OFAV1]MCF2902533.1 hypothetical protein [Pseudoalteromonas sp. OFAV1]
MKIQISVFGVIFAVVSILVAKFVTSAVAPFLQKTLDLTQKQEQWIFLLLVWAIGYWGHALKNLVGTFISNQKSKKANTTEQEI